MHSNAYELQQILDIIINEQLRANAECFVCLFIVIFFFCKRMNAYLVSFACRQKNRLMNVYGMCLDLADSELSPAGIQPLTKWGQRARPSSGRPVTWEKSPPARAAGEH